MKRAALLVLFLVTWKTFSAYPAGATLGHTKNGEMRIDPACELKTEYHQEEFFDWFKAAARATAIKNTPDVYDVSLWQLDDVQPVKK